MLPLWVEFFEDLLKVRGRSQNTVMAYRRDLELFERFLEEKKYPEEKKHLEIGSASSAASPAFPGAFALDDFNRFLKDNRLAQRSQARVISSLRTYLRFCETRGVRILDLGLLRLPRVHVGLPNPLSEAEFTNLFEASRVPDEKERTARNQITLMLLYGLGCLVTELIELNLEDFQPQFHELRVMGKGKKERRVQLSVHLSNNLSHYLDHYRQALLKKNLKGELLMTSSILINDRGHRPSRVDVWRWLAAWSTRAGYSETVHPHRFRHACATALLASGADLRSIQRHLGHSSIQTTQVYTQVCTQAAEPAAADNK